MASLVLLASSLTGVHPAAAAHGVSVEAFVEIGGTETAPTATLTLENAWTSADRLRNVVIWGPDGSLLSITPTESESQTTSGGVTITLQTFVFALPTTGPAGLYQIGMTSSACGCRAAAFNVTSSAYVSFQTGFFYDPSDPLGHAGSPRFNAALLRNIAAGQTFSQDLGGLSPNGHALRYSFIEDTRSISGTDRILRDGAPVTLAGLSANQAVSGTRERAWNTNPNALMADLATLGGSTGQLTIPSATTSAVIAQGQSRLSIKILIEEIETVGGTEHVRGFATRDIGFSIIATDNIAPQLSATVNGAALPSGAIELSPGQTLDVVVTATDLNAAGTLTSQTVTIATQNRPSWATVLTPNPDPTNPRTRTIRFAPQPGDALGTRTVIVTATDNDTFPLTSQLLIVVELTTAPTLTLGELSMTVAWSPISGADGYRVRYRVVGTSDWVVTDPLLGQSTSSTTISGLTNGSIYEFQVASFTVTDGTETLGTWSKSSTRTVIAAPTITAITAGDEQASVSFTLAGSADSIQYELAGSGTWVTASGTTSPLTITGLTNDAAVAIRIRAVVGSDVGMPSNSVSVTPSGATGIVTSSGTARLSGTSVIVDPGLTLTGSQQLTGATAVVDDPSSGDTLACPPSLAPGLSCTFNSSTGVLTVTGTGSVASYQAALRGVTFATTASATTDRIIRFSLAGTAFFLPETGHYYEWVTASGIEWTAARDRAADMSEYGTSGHPRGMAGLQGYLVTVTSAAENDALKSRLAGQGWMGASDELDDKQWRWVTGPEGLEDGGKGRWFFTQAGYVAGGTNTCGAGAAAIALQPRDANGDLYYSNWDASEPNDWSGGCKGGEDYAHFLGDGKWNDYPVQLGGISGYVVEYGGMPGDPALPAPLTATRIVTPLPSQTITTPGLAASATFTYGQTLSFTASATSTLPVSIAASGAGCSLAGPVDGTWTLTWVAAGSCSVAATQAGLDEAPEAGGFRAATPVVRTITTARRPVVVLGLSATSRVYDGTTTVALSGTPTLRSGDVLAGDAGEVTLIGTASGALPTAAVGQSRAVTVSGLELSGAEADRYQISASGLSVDITRRPIALTGAFVVVDRPYDGSAAVTIATNSFALEQASGDRGRIAGDTLMIGGLAAQADDALPGTRTATLTAATISGAAASNYLLSFADVPTTTFAITGRILTVSGGSITALDKVYDGTDAATITGSGLTLSGFAGGDTLADITWTPTGRFTVASAGTGRNVELVGGAVLGGAKGAGYVLDVTGGPSATATITPRALTITGATAAARPYDGTTAVTVSGAALVNTVAGDAVALANATTGVAATRDAGSRPVTTSMTLTGADAANYRLVAQPSLTVTITPLPVSITMNALPSRPYDGTVAVPLAAGAFSVSGVRPGESIAVSGTGLLSSRTAGTRVATLAAPTFTPGGGTTLTNYVLPSSITGTMTITPLALRVSGARVVQREWDGTAAASITGATLEGVRSGDNVSLSGATSGTFASSQPGTHAVTYAPTLIGVDASNYTLSVPPLTGTIGRAPATLRITGGLTQVADGTARSVRAAVSPTSAGRIVISYGSGGAPTAPGTYTVTVTLDSATHEASPLSATLAIESLDSLLSSLATSTSTNPTSGASSDDRATDETRREQLLARIAVRADGTLALPEIGPVLERDGTNPALAPRDHRVLVDGEPSTARIIVLEQQRVRIERDDSGAGDFTIDLQAFIGSGDGRVPLPVDADGTLLLDPGGFVEVAGSGFKPGTTAEVWMFSTATFLGTAIVDADGGFEGAFLVDDLLAAGDHTIQLNGIGVDDQVRSTSLGVRVDDPDAPTRERVVLASDGARELPAAVIGPAWLLLLAALFGAGITRWWLVGRRRRDEDAAAEAKRVSAVR